MAKTPKKSEADDEFEEDEFVEDDELVEDADEGEDEDEYEDEDDEEEEEEECEDEEEYEDEVEEFSLEDLSQAYAGVLKKSEGDAEPEESADEKKKAGGRRGKLVAEKLADESVDEPEEERVKKVVDDNAACRISPESIVESILFVGVPRGEKLTSRKIASILRDVSPKEVTKIVKTLNSRYESENCAYRVTTDKKGSIKLEIAPDLNEFQNEYYGRNRHVQLAQTAIDVLAVIAYKQPVTLKEIEIIRGKPARNVIRQLVRRDLVAVELDEKKSKTKYYSTTDRFLDLFQLDDLDDLPQSHNVDSIDEFED